MGQESFKLLLGKRSIHCLILFLAVFGFYFTATQNGFVWDDISLIVENYNIRSVERLLSVFHSDLHLVGGNHANFYRPVQALSFAVDYFFFGISAFWFHLSSVILHCFNVLLVYILISKLSGKALKAFVVALFFGVFPPNTEAVSYISGRADLLVMFFMLSSCILYIKFLEKQNFKYYFISIFSFAIALGSKEYAIIFPFVMASYSCCFRKEGERRKCYFLLPYLLLDIGYLFLRKTVLDFSIEYQSVQIDVITRILNAFKIFYMYLKIAVYPIGLHMEHAFSPAMGIFEIEVVLGIIFFALMIFAAIKIHAFNKTAFFGISWFLITLLPVLNIFIVLNAFISEHWLYFPIVGLIIALVSTVDYYLAKTNHQMLKAGVSVFVVLVFVIYGSLTVSANGVWKDNITLYNNILEKGSPTFRIYNNLGIEYSKKDNFKKAMECYSKALKLNPESPDIYNNLGIIYKKQAKFDRALKCYEKVLKLSPEYPSVYNNLGNIYRTKGMYEKAVKMYVEALVRMPHNSLLYCNLGSLYVDMGMYNKAIEFLVKAMHKDTKNVKAYKQLGRVYRKMKLYGDAVYYLEKGLEIEPYNEDLQTDLEAVLREVRFK